LIEANCLCAHHESLWGSGGIAPLILNLGTRWSDQLHVLVTLYPEEGDACT